MIAFGQRQECQIALFWEIVNGTEAVHPILRWKYSKNKEKGHANHSKVEKVAGSMAEAIIVVYMRKSNRPNRIRGNWSIKQCFHKHDTCERPQFAVKSSCDQKVMTVVVMWTNERI